MTNASKDFKSSLRLLIRFTRASREKREREQRWQRRVHSKKQSLKALIVSITGQVGGFEPVEKYAQLKWDHPEVGMNISKN